MKLGELIKILQKLPQDTVFESGFTNPHSYRGSYYELAVEPKESKILVKALDVAVVRL